MPFILMTDTDSALLMFIIIADRNCDVGEKTMKKNAQNNIYQRLDTSNKYFEQFNKKNSRIRKYVRLLVELTLIRKNTTKFMRFCLKQIRSISG